MQFALGQNLVLLRANGEQVHPPFLRWLARSPQWWAQVETFLNVGAVFDSLRCADVPKFRLRVPPKSEQLAISTLLGALDDKIELNRQTNKTLEALARAIFKDWFVDFGPTRAKAEGRAPYLAPALWHLFPDRLDAEGKPEGWRRERIGEHVKAAKGLSYKGSGLTTAVSGMPLHNLNSVLEGGGYKTTGLKFYAGDYKPKHTVQPGDLIVANTEQGFDHLLIGYSAIVPRWTGKEALFSHHLYRVDPLSDSPLSRTWLHFALSASWVGDVIRRFSNGTTVNMLPADAFELPEVPVPRKEIVSAFDALVEPMLRRQEDSFRESQTLAQSRDLLLPKLMSGEIRLRDAERMVQDAA
jgi:type I restriction enzyme S subunit